MFGIRKKGRVHSQKVHNAILGWLTPSIGNLRSKLRLPGRIRLLNRWCKHNPRKMMGYYTGFAVLLLAMNVIGFFIPSNESDGNTLNLAEINASGETISRMATINNNQQAIQEAIEEYANANLKLATRLDSLLNLKELTREDSLEVYSLARKLKIGKENQRNEQYKLTQYKSLYYDQSKTD